MLNLHKSENEEILQDRLINRVEDHLNLKHWGFTLDYKSYTNGYVAIYNSSICRVQFTLTLDQREKNDSITIEYGRSHAPNDKNFMVYQGENCLAWHDLFLGYVGQFLDGVAPHDLAHARIERKRFPSKARKAFDDNGIGIGSQSPIWGLQIEHFTWEYYGEKLFTLFDLNNSSQWNAYISFLFDFYTELKTDPVEKKIIDKRPSFKPLPWQVC